MKKQILFALLVTSMGSIYPITLRPKSPSSVSKKDAKEANQWLYALTFQLATAIGLEGDRNDDKRLSVPPEALSAISFSKKNKFKQGDLVVVSRNDGTYKIAVIDFPVTGGYYVRLGLSNDEKKSEEFSPGQLGKFPGNPNIKLYK